MVTKRLTSRLMAKRIWVFRTAIGKIKILMGSVREPDPIPFGLGAKR